MSQGRKPQYDPPPYPPPRQGDPLDDPPPPYHDWTSVPDTALLPPPPTIGHEVSPTGNATWDDAHRAREWCKQNPLYPPHQPLPSHIAPAHSGSAYLQMPQGWKGKLMQRGLGQWQGRASRGSTDTCLMTELPLYFAKVDSPLKTKKEVTVYFELRVDRTSKEQEPDGNLPLLAVGFCAAPYPAIRLPGWERGSLAVHGDDGRRYVNDSDGGKDFTDAFRDGDTVGLGVRYSPAHEHGRVEGEVFFTRNGQLQGGWNVHEELDADNEFGALGLDGQYDLYGAVGAFGDVAFTAFFRREDWRYNPNA